MGKWRLIDQLEHEAGIYDGEEAPPNNLKSADWFNQNYKPNAEQPATVTLAEAWQTHMCHMSHGPLSADAWLSGLEHVFGEGISPAMASSLMSMFVYFGTGVGYGTLHQSFIGKVVSDEHNSTSIWRSHLYGYWTEQFFGRYSRQQGTEKRLRSIVATEFTVDHFTDFITLLDFLSTTTGAKLLNEALVRGGKEAAVTIRTPAQIWRLTLAKKNAGGEHLEVFALRRSTLIRHYRRVQRLAPPSEVNVHTSLDGNYYLDGSKLVLLE